MVVFPVSVVAAQAVDTVEELGKVLGGAFKTVPDKAVGAAVTELSNWLLTAAARDKDSNPRSRSVHEEVGIPVSV